MPFMLRMPDNKKRIEPIGKDDRYQHNRATAYQAAQLFYAWGNPKLQLSAQRVATATAGAARA